MTLWPVIHGIWHYELFPWFDLSPRVRVRYILRKPTWTIPHTDVLIFGGRKTPRYYPRLRSCFDQAVQLTWADRFIDDDSTNYDDLVAQGLLRDDLPIVAGSAFVASILGELGRDSLAVICPGVDTGVFNPGDNQMSSAQSSPNAVPTVGMILRKGLTKDLREGIAALEQLRARGYRFNVIGVGPQRPPDLPSWFHSRTADDDRDMAQFYRECSIFLLPSRYEGFGLPALEAMACGAAVVSTDNGGITDFARSGENMLIARVGSPESMADQVAVLLSDDVQRQRLAVAGLETAKGFSWDKAADAFERVLNDLMRRPGITGERPQ